MRAVVLDPVSDVTYMQTVWNDFVSIDYIKGQERVRAYSLPVFVGLYAQHCIVLPCMQVRYSRERSIDIVRRLIRLTITVWCMVANGGNTISGARRRHRSEMTSPFDTKTSQKSLFTLYKLPKRNYSLESNTNKKVFYRTTPKLQPKPERSDASGLRFDDVTGFYLLIYFTKKV